MPSLVPATFAGARSNDVCSQARCLDRFDLLPTLPGFYASRLIPRYYSSPLHAGTIHSGLFYFVFWDSIPIGDCPVASQPLLTCLEHLHMANLADGAVYSTQSGSPSAGNTSSRLGTSSLSQYTALAQPHGEGYSLTAFTPSCPGRKLPLRKPQTIPDY
jgi:hypothetical protein